jgi:hypothetical protein
MLLVQVFGTIPCVNVSSCFSTADYVSTYLDFAQS